MRLVATGIGILALAASLVDGQNILGQYTAPFPYTTAVVYEQAAQFATPDGLGGLYFFNPPDNSVHRFNATGNQLWSASVNFGSLTGVVTGMAVASDGVYVAGQVNGALPGQTSSGPYNAFTIKYDLNGNTLWTKEFGTAAGNYVRTIATSPDGVYVLGATGIAAQFPPLFVYHLDANGNQIWTRQFADAALADIFGAAADSTGVYFFGYPAQAVRKFDTAGNDLWTAQVGPASNISSLAPDGQGVYVSVLSGSGVFVLRLDLTGTQMWTRQFNSSGIGASVAADATGYYVAGAAFSALPGQCYSGEGDVYLTRFDTAGNPIWTREFGSAEFERSAEIVIGPSEVDVSGYGGATGGPFVTRIEPSSAPPTGSQPRILQECVLNAANYLGGGVAPGEIVTILGSNMGPSTVAQLQSTPAGLVPTALAGVRILFDGEAAPLVYVSDQQSSAVVPYDVAGKSTVNVQVEYNGVQSSPVSMPVFDSRLGIFSFGPEGTGQAAIINQDGTVNSSLNPAAPGSTVSVYATGGGLPQIPGADNQIAGSSPSTFTSTAYVRLDSDGSCDTPYFPAEVVYYGYAPDELPGLVQINAQLPPDAPAGDAVPLFLGLLPGSIVEQIVTIAIQ